MADQDTELSTERPQTPTTRFGASSGSPSFGEAIEKPPALSPDETQVESSESSLGEENSPLGSPHERSLIDNDDDSTFEEDSESTGSLEEEYEETINGRRYTTFVPNVYPSTPTDGCFLEVMDVIHAAITELFDGELCQAPVMNEAQKVLDVGTGTGIWAIDFAESNPQAKVYGSDISLIQPEWVPFNLRLPGGYLESHEQSLCFYFRDPIPSDPDLEDLIDAIKTWNSIFGNMEEKLHRSFTVADDETQRKVMNKAGFIDLKRYSKQMGSYIVHEAELWFKPQRKFTTPKNRSISY
ncbi:hypothetical protein CDV31_016573 [Fusarium ambrosium]|uniref:Methyltransferase domain-containing protein n=1 Tax=Fusarium ambrosium TaxID=131363 RepID=A0A428S6A9_9HYPO|nr:hypothetical protein CDV31_016573 [Fusarium ambrosium]